jgi:hypothetical protein
MTDPTDPIHFHTQGRDDEPPHKEQPTGWYFWDETGANRYGPYETEAKARAWMTYYVEMELGE